VTGLTRNNADGDRMGRGREGKGTRRGGKRREIEELIVPS